MDDIKKNWWMAKAAGWLLVGAVLTGAWANSALNWQTPPDAHNHVVSQEWSK